ncbi:hypothetical protein J6590_050056 [Homalodisca vitripennis]|nr:hypothetical protein J6590_050056 [Homalodisca vitripennis]
MPFSTTSTREAGGVNLPITCSVVQETSDLLHRKPIGRLPRRAMLTTSAVGSAPFRV